MLLCDAWLILILIYLLSRLLTPWHFFPGFEHFEVRQVHVHCNRSLKVGPMNHEHPIASLQLEHVAIVALCCIVDMLYIFGI